MLILYLPFALLKCTQTAAFVKINISRAIDKMMQPIAPAETPLLLSVAATAVDTKINRGGVIDRNHVTILF